MGCSPCEACRVESEMRQLVGGAGTPVYRSSALTVRVSRSFLPARFLSPRGFTFLHKFGVLAE